MFGEKAAPKNGTAANRKNKKPKIVTLLYVAAIILLIVGCYMIYTSIAYVISYYSGYGMSVSSGMKDMIQYVITNSLSYFIYALLVFAAGRIYLKLNALVPDPVKVKMKMTPQAAKIIDSASKEDGTDDAAVSEDTEDDENKAE